MTTTQGATNMAGPAGVQITVDTLRGIKSEIDAIDAKIEAASDSASGGRISIRNEWVESAKDFTAKIVEQVSAALEKQNATDEFKAGVFYGLNKSLKAALGDPAETVLDAAAEARKASGGESGPTLSPEEITSLREARKEQVSNFHAVKGILGMFGSKEEADTVPEPKIMRGAVAGTKRGPRLINLLKYSVDGVEVPEDKNSLSGLAEICGLAKAKEVRDILKAAGVNTAKPKNFSVEVNGHQVVATGSTVEDEAPASESEAA